MILITPVGRWHLLSKLYSNKFSVLDFEYYNVFENFSFYEAYSEGKNISDEILNISFRKDFSLIKWTHSKDSATVLFSLGVHSAVRNHPNRGSVAAAAKSLQSCSTLCDPKLRCPWDFSRQEHWSGVPLPSPNRHFTARKTYLSVSCYVSYTESRNSVASPITYFTSASSNNNYLAILFSIINWSKNLPFTRK